MFPVLLRRQVEVHYMLKERGCVSKVSSNGLLNKISLERIGDQIIEVSNKSMNQVWQRNVFALRLFLDGFCVDSRPNPLRFKSLTRLALISFLCNSSIP